MKPGDKVICIDAARPMWTKKDLGLEEGREYVLRWVGNVTHYVEGTYLGVKLVGIDRGPDDGEDGFGFDDLPYRASRFRPVVSGKNEKELEVAE